MKQYLFSRRSLAPWGTLAVLLASVAASPRLLRLRRSTRRCARLRRSHSRFSPSQTATGTRWRQGRASTISTALAGCSVAAPRSSRPGSRTAPPASVLDLPSGSKAVSPTICVTSSYPTARTMVRNVIGAEGVFFYVSYAGTKTWATPRRTRVRSTAAARPGRLSTPVNLQPYNSLGLAADADHIDTRRRRRATSSSTTCSSTPACEADHRPARCRSAPLEMMTARLRHASGGGARASHISSQPPLRAARMDRRRFQPRSANPPARPMQRACAQRSGLRRCRGRNRTPPEQDLVWPSTRLV